MQAPVAGPGTCGCRLSCSVLLCPARSGPVPSSPVRPGRAVRAAGPRSRAAGRPLPVTSPRGDVSPGGAGAAGSGGRRRGAERVGAAGAAAAQRGAPALRSFRPSLCSCLRSAAAPVPMSGLRAPGVRPVPTCLLLLGLLLPAAGAGCELEAADGGGGRRGGRGGAAGSAAESVTGNGPRASHRRAALGGGVGRCSPGRLRAASRRREAGRGAALQRAPGRSAGGPAAAAALRYCPARPFPGSSPPQDVCRILLNSDIVEIRSRRFRVGSRGAARAGVGGPAGRGQSGRARPPRRRTRGAASGGHGPEPARAARGSCCIAARLLQGRVSIPAPRGV